MPLKYDFSVQNMSVTFDAGVEYHSTDAPQDAVTPGIPY